MELAGTSSSRLVTRDRILVGRAPTVISTAWSEVNAAAEVIYDLVDPSANLIFGAVIDPSLSGQVSITLIATGFKRQEESDGRPLQATQLATGDANFGLNRRPSSFIEGGSVEIPEFLRKKGRSRYPRA